MNSSIRQQGTSTDAVIDFVKVIGEWTDRLLQKKLLDAPYFSLTIDECTNITAVQELSIYCRWIENGPFYGNTAKKQMLSPFIPC